MIKNTTPYLGRIRLKLEKHPHYSGRDQLNKIHWDLGFTKLVSRITPYQDLDGNKINSICISLIEDHTGGCIRTYEQWLVKVNGETHQVYEQPGEDVEILDHYTLPNSFMTKDGQYIGSIKDGWWYYKNNFKVYDEYPHGVAIMVDSYSTNNIIGYYGYTHRGGQAFKIGDRLFEANYVPKEEDYEEWEWAGWEIEAEESTARNLAEGWYNEGDKTLIVDVIPFIKRGRKIIRTEAGAIQAAINLSKYLS